MTEINKQKAEKAAKRMLEALGIDMESENFVETPRRIVDAYVELMEGRNTKDRVRNILSTAFSSEYRGIESVSNIEAHSICPHHMFPIRYDVDFGYIPSGKVLGISKIPRFIKLLSKRPVLQEDLTREIVEIFQSEVKSAGCICIVKGEHQCMRARGVKSKSPVVTSEIRGTFKESSKAKDEVLKLLNMGT